MSWVHRASLRHTVRHRSQPRDGTQLTLHRQRVYIFPTTAGFSFAVLILGLLIGALNYNNNLGYLLTFILSGLGIAAILHTYRNLAGLRVRVGHAPAVFAQTVARFELWLENPSTTPRYSLVLRNDQSQVRVDLAAGGEMRVELSRIASRRGALALGPAVLATYFPLGLLQAWAHLDLAADCWVYPEPKGSLPLPPLAALTAAGTLASGAGEEDFAGLRPYQAGDAPRRIHWPAWARNEQLWVKSFAAAQGRWRWLDMQQIPEPEIEMRLSQLCRWVLTAEATGIAYGLRLPGLEIPPATGPAHCHHCLEALARHGQTPPAPRPTP